MPQKTNDIRFIEGRRCYLRPVTDRDANDEYLSWLNKQEILQYLDYGRLPTTLKNLKRYIREKSGSDNVVFLAIVTRQGNRYIGNVKLEPINWVNRTTGFSIFIGNKRYRDRGIGSEVMKMAIECAFYRLNLRRISLGVIEGNDRAMALYRKFGFKTEGVEREAIYDTRRRQYINNIKMALLRKDYERQANRK